MAQGRTGNRRYRRNREQLLNDSDICWLCGLPGADSADHYLPYSKGGGDEIENLRPAHLACNKKRNNKDASKVTIRKSPGYKF